MIHYLLQIVIFQLLFLVVYDLFLKKETFFKWNRLYLLAAPILSFILPFVKIDFIRQNIPEQFVIHLPTVILGSNGSSGMSSEILDTVSLTAGNALSIAQILQVVWMVGAVVSLFIFVYKLFRIVKLKRSGIKKKIDEVFIVSLPHTDVAFSFFKTIFLGEALSEAQKTNILLHEKIHIRERHSLDLVFFEVLRILLVQSSHLYFSE